eukprot:COSAG03_NODE_4863_length_1410_cov_1.902365_2_plen_32_part_01
MLGGCGLGSWQVHSVALSRARSLSLSLSLSLS